jgi:CubicO group peptidase (beta-lactamase class C family)
MMKKFKKIGKIVLWVVGSLAAILAVFLLAMCVLYSPEFVRRCLFSGAETVYDYQIFPERKLEASPNPYTYKSDFDETGVKSAFEANPNVGNLDELLVSTGTQAFIVIQDDVVRYEKYFNGAQRDTVVTSFSTAKSIDSALVGFAIADGYIKSLDDPITDYLPELAERDVRFRKISIRNLLEMNSGIRFVERDISFFDDGNRTYRFPDMRRLALEMTEIDAPPGEFVYNPYNPLVVGLILERVTGKTVTQYLQEKLWTPLGMEFNGSWSLDSQETGYEKMESGINGRAIDFAKFGSLYLHQGVFNGAQIIPAEWVAESTTPDGAVKLEENAYYKYFWWGLKRGEKGYDYFAWGNLGQFIYISPANNLIIVRNGERYGLEGEGPAWGDIFYQFASVYGKSQ